MKKPVTEYQWEAFDPDTGKVVKRGIKRTSFTKVATAAIDMQNYIAGLPDDKGHTRPLTPLMKGLEVRIMERTITPWVEVGSEVIGE
jgi:hypothetical protein